MDARKDASSQDTKDNQEPVAAAPDSLDCLPDEVIERILAFTYATDVTAAANATILSKQLYLMSTKPLAATLVKLLKEADQPRADAKTKRKQALKLAACKPFLMFTKPNAKSSCAVAYAAESVDVYAQQCFLEIARNSDLTAAWLSAVESASFVCDVSEEDYPADVVAEYKGIKLPDNYLLPLYSAYRQQVYLIHEPIIVPDEYFEKMDKILNVTQKAIARELAKLKHWMKDEFFRSFESWADENEFKSVEPLACWSASYLDEENMETCTMLVESLSEDCVVYRGVDNEPSITADAPLVAETCLTDFSAFARLYSIRKIRHAELVETTRNSLLPSASK